jgi:2-octaprenyl-6-methoxyphenol hydroxylase
VGRGPVGLIAAIALARAGASVTLIGPAAPPKDDGRAAAIIGTAADYLRTIGVLGALEDRGAPLAAIRIIDATGSIARAPTVLFKAAELGRRDFGISVLTADIVRALTGIAAAEPGIRLLDTTVSAAVPGEAAVDLTLENGERLGAGLVIAADGQRSVLREAAGIAVRRWSYPQQAMTFLVRHPLDHEDVSSEFHTAEGPFTLVPAGDGLSSVVWMTGVRRARALMARDDESFARAAEATCQSILGPLTLVGQRGSYPMGGLAAERFLAGRIALVGETAHAFPPIGAQGLNLGIRDVEGLVRALRPILPRLQDGTAGADRIERALGPWDRDRRHDSLLRTAAVDALNRSLLAGLLPIAAIRGAGMAALGTIAPLRRFAMRIGMGQSPLAALINGTDRPGSAAR